MKKYFILIFSLLSLFGSSQTRAQEFFDTSDPDKFFRIGARAGFNTSVRTFPGGHYNLWNNNSWGTGLNVGAVANLNFKEYLTLQPGFFFESRSGNFAYLTEYITGYGTNAEHYELGHHRGYYFTIPVMGILKFNLSPKIKWSVEFGPYLQINLKDTGQNNVAVLYRLPQSNNYSQYIAELRGFDIGFKMGSGLLLYSHYYVGFHYLAGACNAWKRPSGGHNKSWMFSIGYDF
ncbi:MAG: PorT family protein [Muribaculaceae bacterium]|nr:PorT family protein [Muribaculaceae bacterium]